MRTHVIHTAITLLACGTLALATPAHASPHPPAQGTAASATAASAKVGSRLNLDCAAYALYLDKANQVHHVGSRVVKQGGSNVDQMYDRNLGIKLTETPTAAAALRIAATGTTITTVLVYTTLNGDLKRATIVSTVHPGGGISSTMKPAVTLVKGAMNGTRALAASLTAQGGTTLYSLAGPYLVRYDLKPDLSGIIGLKHLATTMSGVRSISFGGSAPVNGVIYDHLRALNGDTMIEIRSARATKPAVQITRLGYPGWKIYTHLFTGGCTRSLNVMLDLAVREDGTTDLWYEPNSKTTPRVGMQKLARFGSLKLPPGRFHG